MGLVDTLMEGQLPVEGREFVVIGEIFKATKKQTMQVVDSSENMPKNSVHQKLSGEDETIKTEIGNNDEEAESVANIGEWIACGAEGEKWVIGEDAFKKLYKISGNIAIPIQEKAFLKIKTNTRKMVWRNAYNETKKIQKDSEYYLMANDAKDLETFNWKNINPMDIGAFNKTY